jgi:hypothetical protein
MARFSKSAVQSKNWKCPWILGYVSSTLSMVTQNLINMVAVTVVRRHGINSRITLSSIASTASSPAYSRQNFETQMICLSIPAEVPPWR